jgi:hypothetical protein
MYLKVRWGFGISPIGYQKRSFLKGGQDYLVRMQNFNIFSIGLLTGNSILKSEKHSVLSLENILVSMILILIDDLRILMIDDQSFLMLIDDQ